MIWRPVSHVLGGQVGFAATQLAWSIVVSRSMPPAERGIVVFAAAAVTLGSQVAERGGELVGVRHGRDGRDLNAILRGVRRGGSARMLIAAGAAGLSAVVAVTGGQGWWASLAVAPAVIWGADLKLAMGWLVGSAQSLRSSLARVANPIASLLFFFVLDSWISALDAAIVAYSLGFYTSLMMARRTSRSQSIATDNTALDDGNSDSQVHLGQLGLNGLYKSNQMVLGLIGRHQELGLFGVAWALAESVQYLASAVAPVLIADRAPRRLRGGVTRILERPRVVVLVATLAGAAALSFFAEAFVVLLYGSEYVESAKLVPPLTIAAVGFSLLRLDWAALIAQNRDRAFMRVALASSIGGTLLIVVVGVASSSASAVAIATALAFCAAAVAFHTVARQSAP